MKEFLTRKGPFNLPMYAWLAGGGALLLGLVVILRRRSAGAGTSTAITPAGATGSQQYPAYPAVPYPYPVAGTPGGPGSTTSPMQSINDMFSWHHADATQFTQVWAWTPQIAQQFDLYPGPQPLSTAPTDASKFAAATQGHPGVPLANSWWFGDIYPLPNAQTAGGVYTGGSVMPFGGAAGTAGSFPSSSPSPYMLPPVQQV